MGGIYDFEKMTQNEPPIIKPFSRKPSKDFKICPNSVPNKNLSKSRWGVLGDTTNLSKIVGGIEECRNA